MKKLGLGEKFLRQLLYMRKIAGGVGLLQPKTIIAMTMAKQYLSCSRMKNRVHSLIKTNEELIDLESRYSKHPIKIKNENRF